jgi:hypothetical protein
MGVHKPVLLWLGIETLPWVSDKMHYVIFIEFTARILLPLKAGFARNPKTCEQIHFSENSLSGMNTRIQRRAFLMQSYSLHFGISAFMSLERLVSARIICSGMPAGSGFRREV